MAAMSGGEAVSLAGEDLPVQGVITDSRKLTEGCLFVPLAGEKFDGHDFAAEALRRGAAAVMWQKDHGVPPAEGPVILVDDTLAALQRLSSAYLQASRARVIGITGSNGKTTTKDIVTSLLSTAYKVHKTQGNFNNHIGLPLTILSMPEDREFAVLEMGMSARGEIALLSGLAQPETAIITNIGESHLEYLGSRQEIARAKLEIVSGMKPGGLLVYNGDEPLIPEALREGRTVKPQQLNTFTFGLQPDNDDYPTGIMFQSGGTVFTSHRFGPDIVFSLPLLGRHNVANALGAMAVAFHYGVSGEQIRKGLEDLLLTGMRIEVMKGVSGLTILNDAYNASPTSMRAAIEVLQSMKGFRRKIAVLGDMLELGEGAEQFHREVGQYLTPEKADFLFAYGALGTYIAEGAAERLPASAVHAYTDKSKLIQELEQFLQPGDIVLVKASRGNRLEEVALHLKNSPLNQS
nr:UDP-N-acetylmuramoyl-tripeptide--D-alanyl-D-alanine ligase [Paenibacillus caui]